MHGLLTVLIWHTNELFCLGTGAVWVSDSSTFDFTSTAFINNSVMTTHQHMPSQHMGGSASQHHRRLAAAWQLVANWSATPSWQMLVRQLAAALHGTVQLRELQSIVWRLLQRHRQQWRYVLALSRHSQQSKNSTRDAKTAPRPASLDAVLDQAYISWKHAVAQPSSGAVLLSDSSGGSFTGTLFW